MIRKFYSWYGKTPVRIIAVVFLLLSASAVADVFTSKSADEIEVTPLPIVKVRPAGIISSASSLDIVGTVKSINEARVESEAAGRVVNVNAEIGDRVSTGFVLVQLENAAERAVVLQAEGVYEAALAAAAQSDIGIDEAEVTLAAAKNKAIGAYRNAFNTTNSIIINTVDDVLRNGESRVLRPIITIDGRQFTSQIISERVEFRSIIDSWRAETIAINAESDLATAIGAAQTDVARVSELVAMLLEVVPRAEPTEFFTESQRLSLQTELTSAQSNLSATQQTLATAVTDMAAAAESLARTKVSGTSGEVSAANAQVKQALGSLRSAQAALAKTIIRAPIAGEVNQIDINLGDFLPAFTEVAVIANNQALEITTFVGGNDRELVEIGQSVTINKTSNGVITNIAPAIDPITKKTQIKIATDSSELSNGDTVLISLRNFDTSSKTPETLLIPLSAVKFAGDNGSIFMVENEILIELPVALGRIRGTSIEINEGLSPSTEIVVDVRGLVAGERVEAIRE